VTLDEAKAALQRGRHLVLVVPPDVEQAAAVWELVSAPVVIVCGDHGSAAEWAAAEERLKARGWLDAGGVPVSNPVGVPAP